MTYRTYFLFLWSSLSWAVCLDGLCGWFLSVNNVFKVDLCCSPRQDSIPCYHLKLFDGAGATLSLPSHQLVAIRAGFALSIIKNNIPPNICV